MDSRLQIVERLVAIIASLSGPFSTLLAMASRFSIMKGLVAGLFSILEKLVACLFLSIFSDFDRCLCELCAIVFNRLYLLMTQNKFTIGMGEGTIYHDNIGSWEGS